jgi:CRISPR-associated endonuclease/helicase Cas3
MDAAAHSRNARGVRHGLADHLRAVAGRAAEFAHVFGAAELAHAAGLYHDLGKFHPDFQQYLDWCDAHPGARGHGGDHKGAGVSYVGDCNGALQLAIVAHHGGLQSPTNLNEWRNEDRVRDRVDEALRLATQELPELAQRPAAIAMPEHADRDEIAGEFFLRMLFSCLVDADFLDTEAHFNIEKSAVRAGALDAALLAAKLRDERVRLARGRDDALRALREHVADVCEEAGDRAPGIYRMTVPTGGGKTLAGMGFALRHAIEHGKRRIIVAIPYTSITDQTAKVYRDIFGGDGVVLEHSSAAYAEDHDDAAPATSEHNWQRLSAENWDAPIVVTTTVQLFQSLLGKRTSGARKLHNLADSVIVLDEVQMLPVHHLDPLLDVLQRLADDYGATVLLSTATQPAFIHARFQGLPEIAPNPPALFRALRRVAYDFPRESWSWHDAADAMRSAPQAMMILNTKKDALAVLSALGDDDALHLSTLLCGAHRRDVLSNVRRRLKKGLPCRLVATQIVEAGVDIDFPLVFRAMGPLDRILQAAGRCNREGKPGHLGRVVVFRPADGGLPPGTYRIATGHTAAVLDQPGFDIHNPDSIGPWFEWLYKTVPTDREGIQKLRANLNYREVARKFQMIEDDSEDVVVPYGTDEQRADLAHTLTLLREETGSARLLMRKLQPYTVAVRRRDINRAVARGLLSPVMDGVWECQANRYHKTRGLTLEGADDELLMA